MTFIDITTPKSPVAVAVPLLQCRAGKREFTPKVCQEVLQSTNFAKNIRDMLTMIAELPAEKQAAFKDVVLSTFDRREQPNDIVVLGKKLAVAGGYEDELNNVDKIGDVDGEYLFSGVGKRAGIVIGEFDEECDYSTYDEVFIASDNVDLSYCDLSSIKNLRFKDGARVDLCYPKNLPEDIDVSMCNKVYLRECDLALVKKLRFKEGAMVYLGKATNLPEDLDVSMCEEVDLRECDLSVVKNLRFKEGAAVSLRNAKNLPEDLDVSMCNKIDLSCCDLSQVKDLRFKEGSRVSLGDARNLPEELDVSVCDYISLKCCDFSNVKQLRFKNKEQKEKSGAEILAVKVAYNEEEEASFWSMLMGKNGR